MFNIYYLFENAARETDLFVYASGFRGGAHPAIGVERELLGIMGL
jgi:hypothetical protein